MRIGKYKITLTVEKILAPVDATDEKIISPGLYVCTGCGWAFRFLGSNKWHGAYWPKTHIDTETYDSLGEWAGAARYMDTEWLYEDYADCFGRLHYTEPILQRVWND